MNLGFRQKAGFDNDELKVSLVEHYRKSSHYSDTQKACSKLYDDYKGIEEPMVHQVEYPTSAFWQFLCLCVRNFKNTWRNPRVSSGQLVTSFIFALVTGGIYFQLDKTATAGLQNRAGAFFFITINTLFACSGAMEPFLAERITFMHESASGYYRVSSYLLAKIIADLLPTRFIPAVLIFAVTSYWMIGLHPAADSFFIYILNFVTTNCAACGVSFYIGSRTRNLSLANMGVVIIFIFMIVFGGLLLNIDALPTWIRWIQYLSIARYCVNTLYINELKDQTFCDPPRNNGTYQYCVEGNDFLESQGIDYSTWGLWQNQVALATLAVGFFFLTYVQLRRIPKSK